MPSGSKLYQFLGIEPKLYTAPVVGIPEPEVEKVEPEVEKKVGRPKKEKKSD